MAENHHRDARQLRAERLPADVLVAALAEVGALRAEDPRSGAEAVRDLAGVPGECEIVDPERQRDLRGAHVRRAEREQRPAGDLEAIARLQLVHFDSERQRALRGGGVACSPERLQPFPGALRTGAEERLAAPRSADPP